MKTGFYLAGSFEKGKKPEFMLLPKNNKPFVFDMEYGKVSSKGLCIMEKKRRYFFADEWRFIPYHKLSELEDKYAKQNPQEFKELISELNDIWHDWCNKYNRKYIPLFECPNIVMEDNDGGK